MPIEGKLTVGRYGYGAAGSGTDLNLRLQRGSTRLWVGSYRDDGAFGDQARAGFDTMITTRVGDVPLQWQPSLQVASGGFVGASLQWQVGDPLYAIVGWGRTNARPYVNLNFDPNDAITLGAGWHDEAGLRSLAAWVIADDRFGTGQRDWHLLAQAPLAGHRVGVDLLRKTGRGDDGFVAGWGLTLTLDVGPVFLRLARDPKMNFSPVDAKRLSVGLRF